MKSLKVGSIARTSRTLMKAWHSCLSPSKVCCTYSLSEITFPPTLNWSATSQILQNCHWSLTQIWKLLLQKQDPWFWILRTCVAANLFQSSSSTLQSPNKSTNTCWDNVDEMYAIKLWSLLIHAINLGFMISSTSSSTLSSPLGSCWVDYSWAEEEPSRSLNRA